MRPALFKQLLTVSLLSGACTIFGCRKTTPEPPPPTDSVNLQSGLLLYLPFNGNFADSSGNNNPTYSLGATLSTDPGGNASSALAGTGNGERVIVTNNGSIKFDSSFTISFNVLTYSTTGQIFVAMADKTTAQGVSFGVGIGVPGLTTVDFSVSDLRSSCSSTILPSNSATDTTNLTLPFATWYNIIGVFDRGTMSFYSNGVLISTQKSISPVVPICPQSEITIGGWWDGDTKSINGKMDEVRLYNRALNAKEIAQLSHGFPVLQQPTQPVVDLKKGLLLYLPFNGSIADSSGNNNATQLIGSAALTYDEHGYANSALGGDGTGGRLIVTNNGSIKFDTAFSVSMSFMERDNSPRTMLLSMANTATGKGVTFGFGNSAPATREVVFGVISNLATCDDFAVGTNTDNDTAHNFIPQQDSWYNIVCTYNHGVQEIYINGVLAGRQSGPYTSTRICPDAKVIIGGWWDGDAISINGKIDNVRLYNRILLPQEIAMLAQHFQPTTNSIRQTITH